MLVVYRKTYMTLLHNVKEVPSFTLLDDNRSRWHSFHHHGVNQKPAFPGTQRSKNTVVFQRRIDELNCGIGLGITRRLVLFVQINGSLCGIMCTDLSAQCGVICHDAFHQQTYHFGRLHWFRFPIRVFDGRLRRGFNSLLVLVLLLLLVS